MDYRRLRLCLSCSSGYLAIAIQDKRWICLLQARGCVYTHV
nr:MAG TPA: hypothetical protein [Caudoviricetes sp.]